MGLRVGKHRNRRAESEAKRGSSRALAGAEEPTLETIRLDSPTATCARGRLRIGVSSFAASESERSESLAFALGQEITAALGRFHRFDVIAAISPSAATPTCSVREHEFRRMNLDYLIDLTLCENGQDIEINTRLLDLRENARPIWSKCLDLASCGPPRIEELVATDIVARIDPGIAPVEGDWKRRNHSVTTGFLRRALPLMCSMERDKFRQAGQLIKLALEIDPDDAEIVTSAARWEHFSVALGEAPHTLQQFVKIRDLALRAMNLNSDNAEALGLYAHYCAFVEKEFDTALHCFDRSLRLNPSLAFIWGLSGPTYCYIGEPRTALQRLDHYRELAPFDPFMSCFELLYAMAYLFDEDYERTAMVGRRAIRIFPDFVNGYKPLLAALGHLGQRDEAKPYLDKLLRLEPGFTVERFGEVYPIKKPRDRKRYMEGLRLAGVPAG
jgi:tetratricopeptide (TPR) repeat protein